MSGTSGLATLRRWAAENRTVLGNASALTASTVVTAGLGFAFWAVAARAFPPEAVGVASATVSSLLLLGTIGMMGLGTLLIGELPRRRAGRGPLLATALTAAGAAAFVLWSLAALAGPHLGDGDLGALLRHPLAAAGVVLVAVGQVLDQASLGLLRGGLQLWRNLAFSLLKLALLIVLVSWTAARGALPMLAAWTVGLAASFGLVAALLAREDTRVLHRPDPRLLLRLRGTSVKHHALDLALAGPPLALPVLATTLVSPDAGAAFYVAWMFVTFAYAVPSHFATVLHAVGSGDQARLAERLRFSLRLSLVLGAAAAAFLLLTAPYLLRLFDPFYEAVAADTLRILALVVPAMALKVHVVAVERVRGRVGRAALLMGGCAFLEVGAAAFGASRVGIDGLALGFVAAVTTQAAWTVPHLVRTVRAPG